MESRLREIVRHMDIESAGHQQEVQVQCALEIEKAGARMRAFEQNAEAAVAKIRFDAQSSVGPDGPRLAQLTMHLVCRSDNLALSVRRLTDMTSICCMVMCGGNGCCRS